LSTRGRFLNDSRRLHRGGGKQCATCTQFYESHGVVHPIRNSPGYDPEVERQGTEHRERARLERTYGHERQERHVSVVARPPWAAGISDSNLLAIASAHGQHASQERWWERAGLYHNRAKRGGQDELDKVLRGGAHRGDVRKAATRKVAKPRAQESRQQSAAIARASALGGSDLPF
jgi:hypothetical protein